VLVSLQVRLKVVFGEALVDFGEWVFFVRVFISQLLQSTTAYREPAMYTHPGLV
jgi:hypothetical protein